MDEAVMVKQVDIHVHLTDGEYSPFSWYLKTYLKFSDVILVCVSVDSKTSLDTVKLAQEFPRKVLPFVGISPQMAEIADIQNFLEDLDKVKDIVVGIGEIGLDRRIGSNQVLSDAQKNIFRVQLEVAEKLGKPVALHTRGTLNETLETLTSYQIKNVLLHWFTGSDDELKEVTDNGYYASFGPAMVSSKRKRQLVCSMPKEYILVETDGPVRFSGCFEGKIALPTFLPTVLLSLSSSLNMSYDDVVSLVFKNSEKYLSIPL
jgi:TatD DNase family protein|tara:strand:- start:2635 stop:3417 length:783 start_codon:yes stop_codon:yes gene_type:complete